MQHCSVRELGCEGSAPAKSRLPARCRLPGLPAQVPTFTIALVFVFFLVVSLAFEYGVRFLSRKFEEHGRPGLVEALSKLVLVSPPERA